MNTALRIASVTYVLRQLLIDGLNNYNSLPNHPDVSGATATAKCPDRIDTSGDTEKSLLNLFMYQVTPNQGWKNTGFPTFNRTGNRISNSPLGIDLHYLLTAYGSEDLHTDILLGYGMQLLHENPILTRKYINTALQAPLIDSSLADQIETITISPEILSIEDISKLWAAFATKYRPTAAYKVTVVLIESDKSTETGPPVQARNIYVRTLKKPVINQVSSQSAQGQPTVEDQKILNSYFIVLSGENFYSEDTQVTINNKTTVPQTSKLVITDTKISFQLTDDLNLATGNHTIKVVQPIAMGNDSPPKLHSGTESEPVSFALSPKVLGIVPKPPAIAIIANALNNIEVTVNPKLKPGQKIALLLNAITANANNEFPSYSFQKTLPGLSSDPNAVPVDEVDLQIGGIQSGKYVVRVQVDGIDSSYFPVKDDNGNIIYTPPTITVQ